MDLQENIYKKVKKTYYMSAGFASRHVVGFEDLSIDVFLEVQNKDIVKSEVGGSEFAFRQAPP